MILKLTPEDHNKKVVFNCSASKHMDVIGTIFFSNDGYYILQDYVQGGEPSEFKKGDPYNYSWYLSKGDDYSLKFYKCDHSIQLTLKRFLDTIIEVW